MGTIYLISDISPTGMKTCKSLIVCRLAPCSEQFGAKYNIKAKKITRDKCDYCQYKYRL